MGEQLEIVLAFIPMATKPQGLWSFPRAQAEPGSSALCPHAMAIAWYASIASSLGCIGKEVPLVMCNKPGPFQASNKTPTATQAALSEPALLRSV